MFFAITCCFLRLPNGFSLGHRTCQMANVNGLGWYIMRVAFQVTGLSSEKASHFGPPSAV